MFRLVVLNLVLPFFYYLFLDLLVTIKSIGETETIFVTKKNCFTNKRTVVVSDDSGSVEIVFWRELVSSVIRLAFYDNRFTLIFFRQNISQLKLIN